MPRADVGFGECRRSAINVRRGCNLCGFWRRVEDEPGFIVPL